MEKYLADSKMFEYEKFSRDCQKLNRPFIKARKNPKTENYLVQLDLVTCNYNLSKTSQDKIEGLFKNEIEFSKIKNQPNSIFKGCNIDRQFVWYDGVLEERLDSFCETLFDLSCNFS